MEPQTNTTEKSFATASLVCGILALAGFCTIIAPFLFGGLSILFAVLSHRKGRQFLGTALGGLITSISGLALAAMILIMTILMLPSMLTDEASLQQLNETAEAMYGMSFEEMLEENYGMSLDELFGTSK